MKGGFIATGARVVVCVAISSLWALGPRLLPAAEEESASEATAAKEAESFERPGYKDIRHLEDWSGLAGRDRTKTGDIFDPIKYVPLTEDGKVWLSLGGQYRLRFESWNDFNFGAGDDDFLLNRFRLHADVHATEYARAFVEGKSALSTDRDLPGGKRGLDVDELDLQQGFVDLKVPIGERGSFTFRPGRRELAFGSQRLVSPLDWSNTRRSWDGFSGILVWEDWEVTAFWTQFAPVRKYEFNKSDAGTEFYGLFAEGALPWSTFGLDLYFLGLERDRATFNGTAGDEDRFTFGGRVHGPIGETPFDADLEGAYQTGEVGSGDVDAFMVALEVGYTLRACPAAPRIHAGFDYASGDESAGGDVETFNHLFPFGHYYLGYIDFTGRQNLIDASTGVSFKPWERVVCAGTVHFFYRASRKDALYNAGGGVVRTGASGSSRFVGTELDLTLKHKIGLHAAVLLGYSRFFAGDFIEESGTDEDADFVYLQFAYTF